MKEALNKYQIVEKLGRACYLVIMDGDSKKHYILKKQPKIIYFKQYISRFIFGGSLPFQNEFRTLALIKDQSNIPQLPVLESKENVYYVLPYIKDTLDFYELDKEFYILIGKSVAEISILPTPKEWWFLKEYLFNKILSPSANFLTRIRRFEQEYKISLNVFLQLYEEVVLTSGSITPRLIHNDLSDNNVIVTSNNDFYFIDWEDAIVENKAIFLDLISISFNKNDFSLNTNIVHGYWENYKLEGTEKKEVVLLLSYSYILYLFKLINMVRYTDTYKEKIRARIKAYNKDIQRLFDFSKQYLK